MKLLQCHVENFGTLSDYDYVFQDGLTILCEANGFGKSTLAAFIKAMFYGFPRTGKRDVSANERKKYLPWQEGRYGGSLVFEYNDTQYRVTRYFGKTAAKDTFSLYNLSRRRESRDFSENMGQELFQLDAEAFSRSTYMPQTSDVMESTPNAIRAKLSNLVDNTDDLNNYETAREQLQKKRKTLKYYSGRGGLVCALEDEIDRLQEKRLQAEDAQQPLAETVQQIQELENKQDLQRAVLEDLRNKIRISSNQESIRTKIKTLQDLRAELQAVKCDLQALDACYPNGYPTAEELSRQRDNAVRAEQLQTELLHALADSEDISLVEQDKNLFPSPEVTQEELQSCQQACRQWENLQAKLSVQMTDAEPSMPAAE